MNKIKLYPYDKSIAEMTKIIFDVEYYIAKGILGIDFKLSGAIDQIQSLNLKSNKKSKLEIQNRKDDLWRSTCFEFFIKRKNEDKYLEFNLSSFGEWNFYEFQYYRSPIQKVSSPINFNFELIHQENNVQLRLLSDLNVFFKIGDLLALNFSSVLLTATGPTYWSQQHSQVKPDFHDPQCFTQEILFE